MRRSSILMGLLVSAALGVGTSMPASAKTLNAVASFTVLADVVKQVGGEHVERNEFGWTEWRSSRFRAVAG